MESYSLHIEYRANYVILICIILTFLSPGKKRQICTASNPAFKHSPLSTVSLPNRYLFHDIIRHAPDKMRAGSVDMAGIEKIWHGYGVVALPR
jgi:hypothetical protein